MKDLRLACRTRPIGLGPVVIGVPRVHVSRQDTLAAPGQRCGFDPNTAPLKSLDPEQSPALKVPQRTTGAPPGGERIGEIITSHHLKDPDGSESLDTVGRQAVAPPHGDSAACSVTMPGWHVAEDFSCAFAGTDLPVRGPGFALSPPVRGTTAWWPEGLLTLRLACRTCRLLPSIVVPPSAHASPSLWSCSRSASSLSKVEPLRTSS